MEIVEFVLGEGYHSTKGGRVSILKDGINFCLPVNVDDVQRGKAIVMPKYQYDPTKIWSPEGSTNRYVNCDRIGGTLTSFNLGIVNM